LRNGSEEELQVVEMKKVHGEIGPASEFLQAHIKGSLRVKGSQILVDGVEHHELKLLLHKFLYHRGLDGYKVHSAQIFWRLYHLMKRRIRNRPRAVLRPPPKRCHTFSLDDSSPGCLEQNRS